MAKTKHTIAGKKTSGKIKAVTKPAQTIAKQSWLTKLCHELENAVAGLTYNFSEADYPYQFFALQQRSLHQENDKLTAQEFLACVGLSEELMNNLNIPADKIIEERAFSAFFPTINDIAAFYGKPVTAAKVKAESKQYRNLEKLLVKRFCDVKVFRVGAVDIRCYICGFIKGGNIAGLMTICIET